MKIKPVLPLIAAAAALAMSFVVPRTSAAMPPPRFTITELGTLGGTNSRALGINARGDVVGEAMLGNGLNRAVIWRNGSVIDLGTLGGDRSQAYAINDRGFVTGRARTAAGRDRPMVYDPVSMTMAELPTVGGQSAANTDDGTAFGINEQNVIGGHSRNAAGALEAFTWQSGVTTGIGTNDSRAWEINESGQLAGWHGAHDGAKAFRWSAGTGLESIGPLQPGDSTFGIGINDWGHVCGSATATGRSRAWFWDGAMLTDLGQAEGFTGGGANHLNNRGQIAGLSYRFATNNARIDNTATLWQDGMAINLNSVLANGDGWYLESAYRMNDAGQIVGWGRKDGYTRGFLLTPVLPAFTFEPLDVPGADATYAFGINNDGLIVGRFEDAGVGRGYLRQTSGVFMPTNYPGATFTEAFGVNSNGFIVGWYKSAAGTNGFLLGTNGTFESIAVPGATVTYALGINGGNTIAGAYHDGAGVQHGFIRDAAGSVTTFDPPGSTYTEAYGINDAGTVAGYFVDAQGERGFVRQADGTFEVFDVPGSEGSGILGINNTGTWTGFYEDESGVHGFVRNAAGVIAPLNFPGHSFTVALGVSDQGVIVGYTAGDDEIVHGFIAHPATKLQQGHTDIGIAFEDGAFEFEIHAEDTDTEYSPDAAVLSLPPLAQTIVPTNASFAFLGAPGEPAWVLPGVENPKLLFLGLAAEEIEQGLFASDELRFTLKGVEGPGHFALYNIDGFGVPQVHMNSGDGVTAADHKTIVAGSHEDFYWAFTAPGLYRVRFQASGTLIAGNQFIESEEVEYCFEVVPIATRLAIARSDSGVSISFRTQDGLTYQLESAPAITGPWTNEGAAFLGTGREKQITVPLSPGAQFFRMKASAGN